MWRWLTRARRGAGTRIERDRRFRVTPLEGEDLERFLARQLDRSAIEQALEMAIRIARVVAARHAQGDVHARLEPKLVQFEAGQAVVTGWDVVTMLPQLSESDSVYYKDAFCGDTRYISPEIVMDPWWLHPSCDQYSVGCILHEMLVGEPPFTGRAGHAILARHMAERPTSVRVVRPDVSDGVEAVVLKALAKKPGDRFPSMLQFTEALEAELERVRRKKTM